LNDFYRHFLSPETTLFLTGFYSPALAAGQANDKLPVAGAPRHFSLSYPIAERKLGVLD
jgi:hypothetical protein